MTAHYHSLTTANAGNLTLEARSRTLQSPPRPPFHFSTSPHSSFTNSHVFVLPVLCHFRASSLPIKSIIYRLGPPESLTKSNPLKARFSWYSFHVKTIELGCCHKKWMRSSFRVQAIYICRLLNGIRWPVRAFGGTLRLVENLWSEQDFRLSDGSGSRPLHIIPLLFPNLL